MAPESHLKQHQWFQIFNPISVYGSRFSTLSVSMAPDCHDLKPLTPRGISFLLCDWVPLMKRDKNGNYNALFCQSSEDEMKLAEQFQTNNATTDFLYEAE